MSAPRTAAEEAVLDAFSLLSAAMVALGPELTADENDALHAARGILGRAIARAAALRGAHRD